MSLVEYQQSVFLQQRGRGLPALGGIEVAIPQLKITYDGTLSCWFSVQLLQLKDCILSVVLWSDTNAKRIFCNGVFAALLQSCG